MESNRSQKEETIRFIGKMIFVDQESDEVKIRKKMIFYDDVQTYEELVYERFISHGKCTRVDFFNGSFCILLIGFDTFREKHDNYLMIRKDDESRDFLRKMN